jgi:hypothetical protein
MLRFAYFFIRITHKYINVIYKKCTFAGEKTVIQM